MKKVFVTICFIIACVMSAVAQEYRVESFEFIPNDLTARMEPRSDRNGRVCGVVKIHVADAIVDVEGPMIGEIVVKGFEKRVYLAHDAKQFILYFQNHVPLKVTFDDFYIPSITNKTTYLLKLTEVKGESQSTLAATDGKVSETSEISTVPQTEPTTNHDVSNDSVKMQTIEKVQQLARTARRLSDNNTTNDISQNNASEVSNIITTPSQTDNDKSETIVDNDSVFTPIETIVAADDVETPEATAISEPTGELNGHGYVDLGLTSGLKWATCNVGASKPEEAGDYFAWGETSPKSEYTEKNSLTYKKKPSKLKSMGIVDSNGNLTMSHDAANVNWGSSWRMPTKEDVKEILENCTCTFFCIDGKRGRKLTGPNGNSIFLPASGKRYSNFVAEDIDDGWFWISSASQGGIPYYADMISFGFLLDAYLNAYNRYMGYSIRPVTE